MSQHAEALAAAIASGEFSLVCGAGGSRAILGSSGAILACHLAGISKWRSVGGASGGAIPAVMLAAGIHPTEILRMTVELDFASLLTRHGSLLRILIAYLMKDRYEKTRPRRGVMGSEKLGDFVETRIPTWPRSYFTVAAVGDSQWLFTADGVFEYDASGVRRISDKPAPLGLALRASCAVPGIIDAVLYEHGGKADYLFDGALGLDGRCPIGVPKRTFGQPADRIIACDVGEDPSKQAQQLRRFWQIFFGKEGLAEQEGILPRNVDGVILIKPDVTNMRSLQFTLTRDQKWQAVMAGFFPAAAQLESKGLLAGANLVRAQAVCQAVQPLLASELPEGQFSFRLEEILKGFGLY